MRTVEELQSELRKIATELEQLKQVEQKESSSEINFHVITRTASRYPLTGHPLCSKDGYTKKKYLTMLLSVVLYDEETLEESLLYIHQIAWGAKYLNGQKDLKAEYIDAQTLEFSKLDETTALLADDELRLLLILEMLLVSGKLRSNKVECLNFITQICSLLKISKHEITFLSNLAAVLLTNDLRQYKCTIKNEYEVFNVYLKKLDIKRKLLYLPNIPYYTDAGGLDVRDVHVCLNGNMFVCEYSYTGGWNFKKSEKKYEQHIVGNVILYVNKLVSEYRYGLLFEDDWEKILKRPLGVITHYLDTPAEIKKWYIANGGKFDEE